MSKKERGSFAAFPSGLFHSRRRWRIWAHHGESIGPKNATSRNEKRQRFLGDESILALAKQLPKQSKQKKRRNTRKIHNPSLEKRPNKKLKWLRQVRFHNE